MVDVETWANGETNRSIGEVEVIGRCDSVRENGRENEGEREREKNKTKQTFGGVDYIVLIVLPMLCPLFNHFRFGPDCVSTTWVKQ